jgi:hypothetical protein
MIRMTDKEYFGTAALSKSQIKQWDIHNPAKFWRACSFNPNKKDIELNEAMVFGSLCHALLFEPNRVMDMFEVNDDLGKLRSNKKWIEAQSKTTKTIISTEELSHATRMMEALNRHQIIRDLLKFAKVEAPFMWHDKEWDIPCKMKTDAETGSEEGIYVIDYKTTGQIDKASEFIDKGGYLFDVGFYSKGIRSKYGKPCVKFIFLFQSTKEGEEDDIRLKVVENYQLEACELETDYVVKQIVPKIKAWLAGDKQVKEKVFLPEIVAESFEISPWHDKAFANTIYKGENK